MARTLTLYEEGRNKETGGGGYGGGGGGPTPPQNRPY
jgi:hypothetical protein